MDISLFSILTSERLMLLLKYAEIRMELLSHSLFFIIHVEWTAVFVFLSLPEWAV